MPPMTKLQKSVARWIEFLYGPIFRVIGFFYRIYSANRARVGASLAKPQVALFFKLLAVAVLVGWMLIWLFATDESRPDLVDEVKRSIGLSEQD